MSELIKRMLFLFLLNLLITSHLAAQKDNNIQYKFSETDTSYSIYGTFKVKAPPECILNICFQHKHIKALANEAKEVNLLREGKNWNQMSYTYRKFYYFENTSVWHRVLNEQKLRIEFYLVSSKNNQKIMPKMISGSGYYQITPMGEYTQIEYHQECILTKEIVTKLQISTIKKGALNYIHRFIVYSEELCKKTLQLNK